MKKGRVSRPWPESGFQGRSKDCWIHRIEAHITEAPKLLGFYPVQGCQALLLMICSAGKQISKHFAAHIPPPFMPTPLNTRLLQPSLQDCVLGTSSHVCVPKFTSPLWLAGERETFSCRRGVRGKMCTQGGAASFTQVLSVSTDFAGGFRSWLEPDVGLADAVQASHAALAVLLRSDPRPPSPPVPPSLSPPSPGRRLS